jgi:hypothetical protein
MEVPEPSTVSFIGSCCNSADIEKNEAVSEATLEVCPENISEKIPALIGRN